MACTADYFRHVTSQLCSSRRRRLLAYMRKGHRATSQSIDSVHQGHGLLARFISLGRHQVTDGVSQWHATRQENHGLQLLYKLNVTERLRHSS